MRPPRSRQPQQRRGVLYTLRRCLGLICLALGVAGVILPIIPGWPFLIPAIALLGTRDPAVRYLHLLLRRTLRYLRTTRVPFLRNLGVRLSDEYLRTKHQFRRLRYR